jgi:hypothetical protein
LPGARGFALAEFDLLLEHREVVGRDLALAAVEKAQGP